jgi:hypothetical protein
MGLVTQVPVGHPLLPFWDGPESQDAVMNNARMRFTGDTNTYSYLADQVVQNVRQHLRGNLLPNIRRLAYKSGPGWWSVSG